VPFLPVPADRTTGETPEAFEVDVPLQVRPFFDQNNAWRPRLKNWNFGADNSRMLRWHCFHFPLVDARNATASQSSSGNTWS
jgi:hypothetical protein